MAHRTYVYVDGFNLYYGSLKGTPYRWLDIAALARRLLDPNKHDILRIKYFTARVGARPNDPDQPTRQQMYLRALDTLAIVEQHFGHYLSHPKRMPLVNPPPGGPRYAEVIKTSEKGSDVNLATHLLVDAYESDYDAAVLITNDSDLAGPVDIVRTRLRRVVGVLNPHKQQAAALQRAATFTKRIRASHLNVCQFPDELKDATGTFHKPSGW